MFSSDNTEVLMLILSTTVFCVSSIAIILIKMNEVRLEDIEDGYSKY